MQITLRPAVAQDFEYCKRLYLSGMSKIIDELNLDRTAQAAGLQQQWVLTEVHIITLDGSDVGWLQTKTQDDELFVAQLFVDTPFQRRGIGKQLLRRTRAELGEHCTLVLLAAPAAGDYYPHLHFEHHPQAWILRPGAILP